MTVFGGPREVFAEIAKLEKERDEWKSIADQLAKSMHPHPKDHPSMFAAKERYMKQAELLGQETK